MQYKSSASPFSIILSVFGILILGLLIWIAVVMFHDGKFMVSVIALIVCPLIFSGVVLGLYSQVEVDYYGIRQKTIYGKREVAWAKIVALHIASNAYGGYNVIVAVNGERNFMVPSSFHSQELLKAIIEAGIKANPSIELRGFWQQFGEPPYGIFQDNRAP